jgi:DNA-binding GntR family transcriptional regulator
MYERIQVVTTDPPPRLDRRSRPRVIADYYIDLIKLGRINDGDRLPTRFEMADLFGVGLMTAQDAVALMRAEGYARSERFKGTYAVARDNDDANRG